MFSSQSALSFTTHLSDIWLPVVWTVNGQEHCIMEVAVVEVVGDYMLAGRHGENESLSLSFQEVVGDYMLGQAW